MIFDAPLGLRIAYYLDLLLIFWRERQLPKRG